jgi:O-antigen ligase
MGAGTAGTARHAELVVAASVAAGVLLVLTVARYAGAVAFGFLIFGVVFSQPALPDLVFGMIILVAVLTGGERWTLRRAPPVVVYILGAFFVLNLVAAAWARSLPEAALFITITGYLIAFGLWLTAYIDSVARARRVMECVTIGATVIAVLALVALFLPFPGRNLLTYYSATRAKGLFDDPNVFGAFMVIPLGFVLAELVESRLLLWRRPWLFLVLIVSGAAVLFSFSRAAWLNAALVVVTMVSVYALRRRGGRQAIATLGVGLAAAAVLVPVVLLTGSTSFLFGRAHVQSYDTARFHGQDASLELARTHVFGIGPGQYAQAVGIAAHSTFLRALGEEGVLGFTLIVAFFLVTLILAWGNVVAGRPTFGISAGLLLGLWVGLIANSIFIDTLHWRHLWLVAGLIWAGSTRSAIGEIATPTPRDLRRPRQAATITSLATTRDAERRQ